MAPGTSEKHTTKRRSWAWTNKLLVSCSMTLFLISVYQKGRKALKNCFLFYFALIDNVETHILFLSSNRFSKVVHGRTSTYLTKETQNACARDYCRYKVASMAKIVNSSYLIMDKQWVREKWKIITTLSDPYHLSLKLISSIWATFIWATSNMDQREYYLFVGFVNILVAHF